MPMNLMAMRTQTSFPGGTFKTYFINFDSLSHSLSFSLTHTFSFSLFISLSVSLTLCLSLSRTLFHSLFNSFTIVLDLFLILSSFSLFSFRCLAFFLFSFFLYSLLFLAHLFFLSLSLCCASCLHEHSFPFSLKNLLFCFLPFPRRTFVLFLFVYDLLLVHEVRLCSAVFNRCSLLDFLIFYLSELTFYRPLCSPPSVFVDFKAPATSYLLSSFSSTPPPPKRTPFFLLRALSLAQGIDLYFFLNQFEKSVSSSAALK